MKRQIVLLGLVFAGFFYGCKFPKSGIEQERCLIGEMKSGKPVITLNEDTLKLGIEKYQKNVKMKADMTEFSIISSNGIWCLLGVSNNNAVKILIKLDLIEGKFYEIKHVEMDENKYYQIGYCYGCKTGCNPQYKHGHIECFPNCDSCIKVESIFEEPIFPVVNQ
jgi:hypothetical protein